MLLVISVKVKKKKNEHEKLTKKNKHFVWDFLYIRPCANVSGHV